MENVVEECANLNSSNAKVFAYCYTRLCHAVCAIKMSYEPIAYVRHRCTFTRGQHEIVSILLAVFGAAIIQIDFVSRLVCFIADYLKNRKLVY